LPDVGATIAALHCSHAWYYGPLDVVAVDADRRRVTLHRPGDPENHLVEYRPDSDGAVTLYWNLVSELTDAEREGLAGRPSVTGPMGLDSAP